MTKHNREFVTSMQARIARLERQANARDNTARKDGDAAACIASLERAATDAAATERERDSARRDLAHLAAKGPIAIRATATEALTRATRSACRTGLAKRMGLGGSGPLVQNDGCHQVFSAAAKADQLNGVKQ